MEIKHLVTFISLTALLIIVESKLAVANRENKIIKKVIRIHMTTVTIHFTGVQKAII